MAFETLIYDCAERLLEVCEDALTDPPDITFVTDGDPTTAYTQCPYLAVSMAPAGMFRSINARARGNSLPGRPTMKTGIPQITYLVTLISTVCWPTQDDDGGMPDPAVISAAALQVLTDRKEIWSALWESTSDGSLFAGLLAGNDCASIGEQPTTAFGPSGLVAGTQYRVFCDLIPSPEAS